MRAYGKERAFGVLASAVIWLCAPDARAQDSRQLDLELAVRAGIALPAGQTVQRTDVSSAVSNTLPLIVEVGYRVHLNVLVAARAQYAFANVRNTTEGCAGAASCGGSNIALGAEGIYWFLPTQRFVPWAGLGFGYEWLNSEQATVNSIQRSMSSATLRGVQGLVQGGVEVRLSRIVKLGPFVEAQIGRYANASLTITQDTTMMSSDAAITKSAWHEWILFGVRGSLDL